MLLEGIFAAVTTCFYPDGRPYWRKLEQNVDRYSRTPMSGMVLLGSTGEAVMLSDEESRQALRVARDATAPDKVLLAGVGRESVFETLRQADYAASLDYDAVLVRTPHYYRKQLRNREMLTYYQAVADRSPLPVLLYSVPGCTAYDLPIEVVAELVMHPNIVGMKDSSGNVDRIAQLVHATSQFRKRSVRVTTVFSAVTARRCNVRTDLRAAGRFCGRRPLRLRAAALAVSSPPDRRSRPGPGKFDSTVRCTPNASSRRSKREPLAVCWRWQPLPRKPARRSTPRGRRTTRCWRRTSSGALCGRASRYGQNGDSGRKVCAGLEWILRRAAENALAAPGR